MVDLKRQGRLYRSVFVIGGGILLLFATVVVAVQEEIRASIREINDLLKQVSSEDGVKLDGNANPKKPVVKTWFEPGSVILRILVVNPSTTETQTFPVKIYLPKEVSPKDILDLGDLKLNYDPEKELYYVSNEVTLEPGQSIIKLVKMKDIWVFTEEELFAFVNQAKEVAGQLAGTPNAKKATALVLTIERKVQQILKRQGETADKPGEHIQAYREGITVISSVEEDLSELDRLEQEGVAQITGSQGRKGAKNKLAEPDQSDNGSRGVGRALPGRQK